MDEEYHGASTMPMTDTTARLMEYTRHWDDFKNQMGGFETEYVLEDEDGEIFRTPSLEFARALARLLGVF
jgi:hypothetical protein